MGDGYTEADVRLAATVLHADLCGCGDWDPADADASMPSRGYAERVLAALAGAGRLRPPPRDADLPQTVRDEIARVSDEDLRRLANELVDDLEEEFWRRVDAETALEGAKARLRTQPPQDVRQAVIDAVHRADCGCPTPQVHTPDVEEQGAAIADAVLDALAGRLRPEDTRTEAQIRADERRQIAEALRKRAVAFDSYDARDALWEFAKDIHDRRVGPWVPVPTPPEPYRAASIARDGRRPCGECGPGYWIGDEGCQHTELAGPVVGAGMDVAGQPTAGAQTYAPDTQTEDG